jgi:hypothetical protein
MVNVRIYRIMARILISFISLNGEEIRLGQNNREATKECRLYESHLQYGFR